MDCSTDRDSVKKRQKSRPDGLHRTGGRVFYYSVAAMTALMVCMRFSASSKTMDWPPSKTSSVTSMQEMPNLSAICLPMVVF